MQLDRIPKIVQRQPELVSGHRGVGVVGNDILELAGLAIECYDQLQDALRRLKRVRELLFEGREMFFDGEYKFTKAAMAELRELLGVK